VGGDGIQYETAGALGKGERIFITAKLPDYITVGGNDLIEKYLFLTTSHDGFGSITAAFTPIRIVCNNTLNAALRNNTNAFKIRHTVNAKERLEEAHKLMGITNLLSSQLEGIFNQWTRWGVELFFKWIKQHLKVKSFWGYSENAFRIQVYTAIIAYVTVAIMKENLKIKHTTYEILQVLSITLLTKIQLQQLFQENDLQDFKELKANQLILL